VTNLRQLFTLANAFKEGDLPVGGTTDDRVREEARRDLLALTIGEVRRTTFVDDDLTESLERSRRRHFDAHLDPLTIARVKTALLSPNGAAWARQYRGALTSEVIAAVVKVMSDDELSHVSRSLFNPLAGDGVTVGAPQHFGSRVQPNSPGDDPEEILFSVLEGLSYGCGDVILGLNPAADELDTIVALEQLLEGVVQRLELPTRYCVLSDIVKQHQARARARIDVGFQSLAGTSTALRGMVGLDVRGLVDLAGAFDGLYFETGQGSAVTNGAADGVDMVTLESRAYGLARHVRTQVAAGRSSRTRPWMIVNDVAGFIGPEVFRTAEQLERACLEDTTMAKLHGITMGLDVCATFHMGIAPRDLRRTTAAIVERAAPAYLMAVAGNADPMLGYLTTSFREHPQLRAGTGRQIASAMRHRMSALGVLSADGAPNPGADTVARLYAQYTSAGGDRRSSETLEDEGRRKLFALRDRGFDLGVVDTAAADTRLDTIYTHARHALYSVIDPRVIRDVAGHALRARTKSVDRDDYLAHPASGESLHPDDAARVRRLHSGESTQLRVVISDGLNANAINEHLRGVLPPLRQVLAAAGRRIEDVDVVVQNGRVRVGYQIGGLLRADLVIHFIGERPGTGLNTLSAYLTYGRDERGDLRWTPQLDHSMTTAICGIHPHGKPPAAAVAEIARAVARILEERRSGVALGAALRR
jgi:ethanolamine ammonia-lyase large subunit